MNLVKPAVERLLYLDSARGMAAFSVMIAHFIVAFQQTAAPFDKALYPFQLFCYGEGDILFFFVHSGFILSYAITNRLTQTKISSYTRFLVERVFRIYPMFIFIVLVSYLLKQTLFPLDLPLFTSRHLQGFWSRNVDLRALFNELALIHSVSQEGTRRLVPQEWTAAVEILIGCMIPLLLFYLKKVKWSWAYWLSILLFIKILGFNSFLFDFGLGVFIFYHSNLIKKTWQRLAIEAKWGVLALTIVFFTSFFRFASLFNYDRIFIRPGADHVIVSVGCGMFFCILISSTTVQKLLSHPFLITLGRICYSLYLVHMLILIFFADYIVHQFHKDSGLPVLGCIFLFFVFYTVLTFLVSLFTFRTIEKPFNQFGKWLSKKTEKQLILLEKRIFKTKVYPS
jgi:peptidoglycan/LPS O-acetylase OafA/YrhL